MRKRRETQVIWDLKMFCVLMTGSVCIINAQVALKHSRKQVFLKARREGKEINQNQEHAVMHKVQWQNLCTLKGEENILKYCL